MREMIAEAIPTRAGQLYRNSCIPGLSVTFTRDATERDVTILREAFRSMVRAYRSERTIYARFRSTEERNVVLKRMEGACDHQGDLSTPMVILPIDAQANIGPANPPAQKPISFGTASTGMDEDPQPVTQPASGLEISSPGGQKRQSPDPEDLHEVQRYQDEDDIEGRSGQVDARISREKLGGKSTHEKMANTQPSMRKRGGVLGGGS